MRGVQETRELPVKDLTAEECRRLGVHSHECSSDRHKAYLLVRQLDGEATFFHEDEVVRLKKLIENGI